MHRSNEPIGAPVERAPRVFMTMTMSVALLVALVAAASARATDVPTELDGNRYHVTLTETKRISGKGYGCNGAFGSFTDADATREIAPAIDGSGHWVPGQWLFTLWIFPVYPFSFDPGYIVGRSSPDDIDEYTAGTHTVTTSFSDPNSPCSDGTTPPADTATLTWTSTITKRLKPPRPCSRQFAGHGLSPGVRAPNCPVLHADAGGPYKVQRGGIVTLDGSRSTGAIRSYEWRFTLGTGRSKAPSKSNIGKCRSGASRLEPFVGKGEQIKVRMLCDAEVVLTVEGGKGKRATSKRVDIVVTPRDWKTPRPEYTDAPSGFIPPVAPERFALPSFGSDVLWAQNMCLDGRSVTPLCQPCKDAPRAERGHPDLVSCTTDWTKTYTTAMVKRGPFRGWHYARDSDMTVEHIGVVNPHMLPGAAPPRGAKLNFYNANAQAGVPIDAWIAALRQHEGAGDPRVDSSGHQRLFDLGVALLDPRRAVERTVDTDEKKLNERNADCLDDIENRISISGADPLVPIKNFAQPRYFSWSPHGWTLDDYLPPPGTVKGLVPPPCSPLQ